MPVTVIHIGTASGAGCRLCCVCDAVCSGRFEQLFQLFCFVSCSFAPRSSSIKVMVLAILIQLFPQGAVAHEWCQSVRFDDMMIQSCRWGGVV